MSWVEPPETTDEELAEYRRLLHPVPEAEVSAGASWHNSIVFRTSFGAGYRATRHTDGSVSRQTAPSVFNLLTKIAVIFLVADVWTSFGVKHHWHPLLVWMPTAYLIYEMLFAALWKLAPLKRNHGAEHMVFNAYRQLAPMTVSAVRKYSIYSTSCGTPMNVLFAVAWCFSLPLCHSLLVGLVWALVVLGIWSNLHEESFDAYSLWVQRFYLADPNDEDIELALYAIQPLIGPSYRRPSEAKWGKVAS